MALPKLPPASGGPSPGFEKPKTHHIQFDLTGMPPEELLELRGLIDAKLPIKDLKDIDLSRELVLQMLATQRMQNDVLIEKETPANQRAQVANAVGTILGNLIALQAKVYTSERLKKIESVLIATLATLPMDTQREFLDAYEKALAA